MIFRQLFEPLSSTYTYLLGCEESGSAILIDPVYPAWERDLEAINDLGLKLEATIETHIHADHITSALKLKQETGCRIGFPVMDNLACADFDIEEGKPLQFGGMVIEPVFTPGHTDDHFSYHTENRILTGDALLIDGCGRTDFQNGDPATLYRSITEKIFRLPEDTLVYPAHDYQQRRVSTVAQEKTRNPRIGNGRRLEGFIDIMTTLELDYPKFIDYAIPGNRQCGVCPEDLPDRMDEYCAQMTLSPQG